jgi:hypothetical protein
VDKEDWPKVDAWISTCIQQLTAALPGMQTFQQLGGVAAVTGSSGSDAAAAAASGYSKSRPYYARVVSVEGLCVLRNPDDKDTVKVELALEPEAVSAGGLGYTPGDALGIWPSNPPQVRDNRGGGAQGQLLACGNGDGNGYDREVGCHVSRRVPFVLLSSCAGQDTKCVMYETCTACSTSKQLSPLPMCVPCRLLMSCWSSWGQQGMKQ